MNNAINHNKIKNILCLFMLVSGIFASAQVLDTFTSRFNETVKGDVTMIANNMISRTATENYNGSEGNHNFANNVYVDIDGVFDANNDNIDDTFNSSSANLTNPQSQLSCLSIYKAYLYWAAADREPTSDINSENEPNWNYNDVKLMLPGQTDYTTISADQVIYRGRDEAIHLKNDPYICVKDITSQVSSLNDPFGKYQVANVEAKTGSLIGHSGGIIGTSGGWQIVFVYESPKLPSKNISLFDGYANVSAEKNNFDITFDGFQTVPNGDVSANIVIGSLEGDRDLSGDELQIRNVSDVFVPITAPQRASNNFFNSRITVGNSDFTDRNPMSLNTLGFDASVFPLSNPSNSIITNDQTSATLRLTSNQETYGLYLVGLSVDVWAPDLDPIEVVIDSGINPADPNDLIGFNFNFSNKGNDNALGILISSILPPQVAGVIANNLPSGVTSTFNSTTGELVFTIADGMADIGDPSVSVDFQIQLQDECYFLEENCDLSFDLQFTATYNGVQNPNGQTTMSSADLDVCSVGNKLPLIVNINQPTFNWATDTNELDRTIECGDEAALLDAQSLEPEIDTCDFTLTKTSNEFVADDNCPTKGTYTNSWTFTDACGEIKQYVQTITITDTTPPTIIVPDDVITECSNFQRANTGVATGTDTCGSVTISQSDVETEVCGITTTIVRTWTATDECGNSTSADQMIIVQDTTPPIITIPSDITIECTEDESSVNTGVATGVDSCNSVTISQSDVETAACGNTKTIVRTWTATDACGNEASADQTIIVQDTTPPTITAPADITIECGEDESSANTGDATGADTCGSATISQSDVETAACGNTKTIVRTWTATDDCGNTISADQTIIVQDTTPPTITIPADVTIECNEDESSTNTGIATGDDACGSVTISQSDVETAACGNTKTIVRTWTATDACGNEASANQSIIVQDTTPPTITTPADVTLECGEDESSANTGIATGTDTCGSVTISQSDVETAACGNTKTIVRTWTATDDCGNTASADQTIIVQDTTPPTITTPADVTIECGEDESSANTGIATGADTCGSVTISQSDVETAACGNTKTIVRTWTATDDCGNTTSADQTIIVQDTTPPTITAPADLTIECGEDESSANTGIATGDDACGSVTISQSDEETVACGNTKTIVRTWTATDDCGNTMSAEQTIIVQDTTPPTITTPADLTIECNEDESSANTGVATGADTCGSVTISQSDVETAACGNTKTIVRTWTATDDCGNTTSTDQTIIVQDTTPPTITAPADLTIECGEDESSANTGIATGDDTCGSVTISQSDIETAACGNTKTIVRTWTATDDCGNTTSTDQTIIVQDTTPPTITTPSDVTIECNEDESSANTGIATGDDACGSVTISQSDLETAACGNTKTIVRTWTATDACGNTTSADQTIIVQDTTPPTITTPADLTIECNEDESSANTGIATGDDTCGSVTISQSDVETAACGNTKTIVRTWTATDACGNTTSADQTIIVQDTTPPTFTVPANLTVECDIDATDLTITGDVTDEADNCTTGLEAIYIDSITNGNCANESVITRTWSLTDECDNTTTLVQTINVVDTTAPTFTVPADLTIECDIDATDLTITGDVTDEVDNCTSDLEATYSDSIADGNCPSEFVITRTWSLTDDCDNTATLVQTINIVDTTAPTFDVDLPSDVTTECDAIPSIDTITATDNCSEATITLEESTTPGSCDNEYTLVRTWTATDDCGNETILIQTITVQDTTAPSFNETLPADINAECDAVPTAETLTASDNCSTADVTFEENITNGTCIGDYIIERMWSTTDSCGNEAVHTQIITVQDTTAPTLTTPFDENITIECDEIPAIPELMFEDSCSNDIEVVFNETSTQINDFDDYNVIRTWTVTDECGNEAQFVQNITVEINNIIDANDADRCILDAEFDLFDLLSGDFNMDGTWTVVSGNATIDGSLFDPSTVEVGIYTFMYSITDDPCPAEVEVNVTVDDDCVVLPCGTDDVVISKTVTANGDNFNEFFAVTGVEECGFVIELLIFNRWGAEIYKSNNYQNDWNGDARGSSVGSSGKVPSGTYYYIINLKNSGLEPFSGPIYVATK